jgi:single-strand DNA-binding protein
MLNSVALVGNLGHDPEIRYSQSGNACTNIRIAINEKYKDQNGEKQEKTYWIDCVAWGRTAEGK